MLTCAEEIKDELETRETGHVEGGWESGRKRGNESGAAGVRRDDSGQTFVNNSSSRTTVMLHIPFTLP